MKSFSDVELAVLRALIKHRGERARIANFETEGVKASTILKEAAVFNTDLIIRAVVNLVKKDYITLIDPACRRKQDLAEEKLFLKRSTGSIVVNFIAAIKDKGLKTVRLLDEKAERIKRQKELEEAKYEEWGISE